MHIWVVGSKTYCGKFMASIQVQKSHIFHWNNSHCLHLVFSKHLSIKDFCWGRTGNWNPWPKTNCFFSGNTLNNGRLIIKRCAPTKVSRIQGWSHGPDPYQWSQKTLVNGLIMVFTGGYLCTSIQTPKCMEYFYLYTFIIELNHSCS